jgi:hypothetical protein
MLSTSPAESKNQKCWFSPPLQAERNPHRFNRVELAGVFGCTALQAVITRGIEPLGGPVATGARSSSWPLPSGGRAKGPAH